MAKQQIPETRKRATFNNIVSSITNMAKKAAKTAYEIFADISLTQQTHGVNVTNEFLDGMRKKGWEINVVDYKATTNNTLLTIYTAQKPDPQNAGHILDKTSDEWKIDARKLLDGKDITKTIEPMVMSNKAGKQPEPQTPAQ